MNHRSYIHSILVISMVGLCFTRDSYSASHPAEQSCELGISASYFTYEEETLMRERGPFIGLDAAYTYHGSIGRMDQSMFRAEVRGAYGQVNYDGHIQSLIPPYTVTPYRISGLDETLFEGRFLLGQDLRCLWEDMRFTPYLGIAYRHLTDNLEEDPAGYNRSSNYFYCPLGFEISNKKIKEYLIVGRLEYDLFIQGRQKSGETVENTQKDGYGMRGSLKIIKEAGTFDYILEPYITYWEIEDSDIHGSGAYEPSNQTVEYGMRIAVMINTQ